MSVSHIKGDGDACRNGNLSRLDNRAADCFGIHDLLTGEIGNPAVVGIGVAFPDLLNAYNVEPGCFCKDLSFGFCVLKGQLQGIGFGGRRIRGGEGYAVKRIGTGFDATSISWPTASFFRTRMARLELAL